MLLGNEILLNVKMGWRSLRRDRLFSSLNIVGLAVGLAGCLLISGYVVHELSFERMHIRKDRIFRVNAEVPFGKQRFINAAVCAPFAPAAKETIPEVEETVRIRRMHGISIRAGEKDFKEEMIFLADPSFFRVFTMPLLRGDPETALAEPFTVVIDERFARKCFGSEDPVGRTLRFRIGDTFDFKVTGVMKNAPTNTVLNRPVVASYASMAGIDSKEISSWSGWGMTTTFLLLRPGADSRAVEAKVGALMKARLGPKESEGLKHFLQLLPRIYLDQARMGVSNDLSSAGNVTQIAVFSTIALLILLVAVINFINLSTAKIARRMKEVGVRKTCGARRAELVRQFLTESILVAAGAMALGLVLFGLFKPRLDAYLGRSISLDLFSGAGLNLIIVGLVLAVGILAGAYPAFFLSRFSAAAVFRPGASSRASKAGLRRVLVICQFFVAVAMIASTLVVLKQIRFSENKDLGFDAKNLVLLQIPDARRSKNADLLKTEILSRTKARSAAAIAFLPSGQSRGLSIFQLENSPQAPGVQAQTLSFDPDFIPTFGLKIAAGRNFEPGRTAEGEGILVNETAVRAFGLADPIGRTIFREGKPLKIVGVVRDWHTNSLHSRIEPVVMTRSEETAGSLIVRIPRENGPAVLGQIREVWRRLLPGQTYDPVYVDETMVEAYVAEKRLGTILVSFCALTIFVACLGIFGLASFIAEQRTKEIGVRKILGADSASIARLLSKTFVRWVAIAAIPAFPVAFLAVSKWMSGFAYRTSIGAGPFLLAGLAALAVALLSISIQTIRAAMADPIKSLRYE